MDGSLATFFIDDQQGLWSCVHNRFTPGFGNEAEAYRFPKADAVIATASSMLTRSCIRANRVARSAQARFRRSVKNVEDRTSLLSVAAAIAILAAFPIFSTLATFPALAMVSIIGLLWRRCAVLAGWGRRVVLRSGHKLFQLPSIEPNAAASRAHVELHTVAVNSLHRAVVVRA